MTKPHVGLAPLTMVRSRNGGMAAVLANEAVPDHADVEHLAELVKAGAVKAGKPEAVEMVIPDRAPEVPERPVPPFVDRA